ncbi:hypothetical protein CROQUDRAFT_660126 [Cronartium quercuum f. sp. fusiforme G11]|uniref:Uncharacterized protein n=1 Tax=Cronartium quercuum f. sp. fusiforme G11 TaxID=708437 RepID=A0A9P6NEX3_9BASI|nr:hypothetical protein CROQUDRAFT_660126 [Cronartium quercuum f. sp. fusiforme G11]
MTPSTRNVVSNWDWIRVIILGTMGNSLVGGLTGFIGSFILQREAPITIAICWIGALAGMIGGLLHAIVIFALEHQSGSNSAYSSLKLTRLGSKCELIFSHAPCWTAIGALISYLILVGNPLDSTNQISQKLQFSMVLLTAFEGHIAIVIYATTMSWLTGSEDHLLILQNTIILMVRDLLLLKEEEESDQDCEKLIDDFLP